MVTPVSVKNSASCHRKVSRGPLFRLENRSLRTGAFETPFATLERNTESTDGHELRAVDVDVARLECTRQAHWSTKVPWHVCSREWRLYRVVSWLLSPYQKGLGQRPCTYCSWWRWRFSGPCRTARISATERKYTSLAYLTHKHANSIVSDAVATKITDTSILVLYTGPRASI